MTLLSNNLSLRKINAMSIFTVNLSSTLYAKKLMVLPSMDIFLLMSSVWYAIVRNYQLMLHQIASYESFHEILYRQDRFHPTLLK